MYLDLSEKELHELINRFIIDYYLNDVNNPKPILSFELNAKGKSANIELSSVEETNRMIKIEGLLYW